MSSGGPQSSLVSQPFKCSAGGPANREFCRRLLSRATIDFSVPLSGASATLSANSAFTDCSGLATVTVMANPSAGTYAVTTSESGVTSPAWFYLTNSNGQPLGGTHTVIPAPAIVEGCSIQKFKSLKHKAVDEIVLHFSETLIQRLRSSL